VTTRPNTFMRDIHDRMPVVLTRDSWVRWLEIPVAGSETVSRAGHEDDPGGQHPRSAIGAPGAGSFDPPLQALLEPRDDIVLAARLVPTLVNNVRNDGPALIEPLAQPSVSPTLL
jgi:putative SOS response-associated peptidase YedK